MRAAVKSNKTNASLFLGRKGSISSQINMANMPLMAENPIANANLLTPDAGSNRLSNGANIKQVGNVMIPT